MTVRCPQNAHPGEQIEFRLPVPGGGGDDVSGSEAGQDVDAVPLSYGKDVWMREMRASDGRFCLFGCWFTRFGFHFDLPQLSVPCISGCTGSETWRGTMKTIP